MKYLPIHSSSSIWLRDNLWTNLNQFCVQTLWNLSCLLRIFDCMDVSISLNLLVFLLFPRPLLRYMATFHANPVAIVSANANHGGHWRIRGSFIALIWHKFYCTIPRQLILHLHRYNILRSPRGTQFWVSRSKKCLVRKWQYLVFFRYFLTTYIIPFLSADVWKKADKKGYFSLASFFSLSKSLSINCLI